MSYANPMRERLRSGGKLLGLWLSTGRPEAAEIAALAGYHVVIIDLEHAPGDTDELGHLLRAVQLRGAEPMVRVPWNDQVILKRVLELGARSIMIPMVENRAEAEAAVAACRYPPRGRRGYAAGAIRASNYGFKADYAQHAHEELFLALQVETGAAAARAGEIAGVDGCDMVFIGPNDLAGNLGFLERMGEPPVLASIEDAKAKTRAAGKYLGIVPHAGKDATKLAGEGFDFVACGNDVIFLREAARADVAKHAAAYDIHPR